MDFRRRKWRQHPRHVYLPGYAFFHAFSDLNVCFSIRMILVCSTRLSLWSVPMDRSESVINTSVEIPWKVLENSPSGATSPVKHRKWFLQQLGSQAEANRHFQPLEAAACCLGLLKTHPRPACTDSVSSAQGNPVWDVFSARWQAWRWKRSFSSQQKYIQSWASRLLTRSAELWINLILQHTVVSCGDEIIWLGPGWQMLQQANENACFKAQENFCMALLCSPCLPRLWPQRPQFFEEDAFAMHSKNKS